MTLHFIYSVIHSEFRLCFVSKREKELFEEILKECIYQKMEALKILMFYHKISYAKNYYFWKSINFHITSPLALETLVAKRKINGYENNVCVVSYISKINYFYFLHVHISISFYIFPICWLFSFIFNSNISMP